MPWQRTASIGVTLTIPLYQGGAEYSQVRQNRQTVQQQRNVLENSHRTVAETVSSSWDQLLAATATIQSLQSEVRANRIALQGVQEEALVGSRTVLDVLDAEQTLFQSQVNLVTAQATEVTASYTLKSAVGQLTATGIHLPVKPYNPDAYYKQNRNRLFGIDDPSTPQAALGSRPPPTSSRWRRAIEPGASPSRPLCFRRLSTGPYWPPPREWT